MLVAAPLYHMNALAVSQAALAQHDTIILLPGFTAQSYIEAAAAYRATTLDLGADDDRDDVAREGAVGRR